jgi:oligoendopeptidase F
MSKVPLRKESDPADTWDLTPLFPDIDAWREEKRELQKIVPSIASLKGSLNTSPETLKQALDLHFSILERLENLYTYAHLVKDQDTTDSEGNAILQEAQSLWVTYSTCASYISPELLSNPAAHIEALINSPLLGRYRTFLQELERRRAFTRQESEEALLSLAGEVLMSSGKVFRQLTDADMTFDEVLVDGVPKPLTHSSYLSFLLNPSREVRADAFTKYYKTFEVHKYSLSEILQSNLKKDTFIARARGHASSKASGLFGDNIPELVYDTLVNETAKGLPESLHRYYNLRKSVFSLETQCIYDTYVPLIKNPPKGFSYDNAVDILSEALLPLGSEYVEILKKGLTTDRWVDKFENKGKRSGAYSSGTYTSPPYILMNYKEESIESLYTLAHEAGHSMHSYLANRTQDYPDHSYTIFVAEVASTLNELLLTRYLLQHKKDDKEFCSYLLNYQLDAIKGTFFRQTMFAEFEDKIHAASDSNEPLTIDSFRSIYRALLVRYFGQSVTLGELEDLECLRIPHFYSSFYVFKYATGISAAITLAENINSGDANARATYLHFLSSGGSNYSLDLLKDAGADLSTAIPFTRTIQTFNDTLTALCHTQGWSLPAHSV